MDLAELRDYERTFFHDPDPQKKEFNMTDMKEQAKELLNTRFEDLTARERRHILCASYNTISR